MSPYPTVVSVQTLHHMARGMLPKVMRIVLTFEEVHSGSGEDEDKGGKQKA